MNVLLRLLAWLLAITIVVLPVVAVLNGWVGAERWPLAKLRVHGEFKRVPGEELQKVMLPHARAGFFAVDLQQAQRAVEQLPWVESAQVRKQWPDVLRDGDLLLMMGAGDIGHVAQQIVGEGFKEAKPE